MDKNEEIKNKGFHIPLISDTRELYQANQRKNLDFTKLKVGLKTLEDAVITNAGDLKKISPTLADKKEVLNAISKQDYEKMREISDFFFRTNGIYQRLCKYMAQLYCYDWMVTPYVNEGKANEEKRY